MILAIALILYVLILFGGIALVGIMLALLLEKL